MNMNGKDAGEKNRKTLDIVTLGRFQVKSGNNLLSEQSNRSQKVWDLFKFLITYRDRGALPEAVLETLWPAQEYTDPKRALRNQVCRLRHILSSAFPDSNGFITFSHGCYRWNPNIDYTLDAQRFEELCRQGQQLAAQNSPEAAEILQQCIGLYKGDYLPECSHEWVLPVRSYYRRIYLQSALELCRLLKQQERHAEMAKVCESVMMIEPFEEAFHLCFLEALIAQGRTKEALSHYEYATALFYSQLGIKPSPAMKKLYRLLKTGNEHVDIDLTSVQESLLERQEAKGAFACDPDVFRIIYKLDSRRMERTGQSVFLGLLTLVASGPLPPGEMKTAATLLNDLVHDSLRKGDVFTRWNESQFLLILPGLTLEQGEKVLQRIVSSYQAPPGIKLQIKLQPVLPPATYMQVI